METINFYRGKKVLLTGHGGFKGRWLSYWLAHMGAKVVGISLVPVLEEDKSLFSVIVEPFEESFFCDVRDLERLQHIFQYFCPDIVFHLAAQPIVLDSYRDPVGTYSTNVLGTVNLLECVRQTNSVKSVVNVTTDKVYENNEWEWGYRETDRLNGYDPYSNSKSCSELVTACFKRSFFDKSGVAVSTVRAGNVIGGGDFSPHRIIPDCIRAVCAGEKIKVRNPLSIRPYQHVLDPLYAYMMIAAKQYDNPQLAGCYNVGPEVSDCVTTEKLVNLFCKVWGEGAGWALAECANPQHEANFLRLDCSRIKETFGWQPVWNIEKAVEKTVEWAKAWRDGGDVVDVMDRQIAEFSCNCSSFLL
ncbi:CDP-glucose 4,6-dehydratase [Selenomonas ruminantium]|uniref:CDP-glucose 4,6-dehydratase n=1 Tax=Selenomonas ruminantium TaxID=971 RepID=A0A1I0YFJ5_SELRU|nr:CDP-glucose 4,6-dehydratase [Selenomonas ruminantium]SFB12185.1 CDP-glucose 4,6-dehydratase [Selenomonas ruminantium]